MAPKTKSSAKKGGVSKTKGATKSAASQSRPSGGCCGSTTDSDVAKRRRLNRRNTDEACERVIEDRLLPFYSRSLIEGAVNQKGEIIKKVIADHIRENRPSQERIATQCWTSIIETFDLNADAFDDIPDPDDGDGDARPSLVDKIAIAHHKSPAARKTGPLERYLEDVSDLSYTEIFGILQASVESHVLVRAASNRILFALTKYIARICSRSRCRIVTLEHSIRIAGTCVCGEHTTFSYPLRETHTEVRSDDLLPTRGSHRCHWNGGPHMADSC